MLIDQGKIGTPKRRLIKLSEEKKIKNRTIKKFVN